MKSSASRVSFSTAAFLTIVIAMSLVSQYRGGTFTAAYGDTTTWAKTYGGAFHDGASSIDQTSDGGYAVAGSTNSFEDSSGDIWVLKLDSDGNVEWEKTYGGSNVDVAEYIQQTSDGGYVIAGESASFGIDSDIWVLKLGSDGNVEWEKAFHGTEGAFEEPFLDTSHDNFDSLQQTSDGGYVVAGQTSLPAPGGGTTSSFWLFKLDSDGNIEWEKIYDGTVTGSNPRSIKETPDGGYAVTGIVSNPVDDSFDIWILKLDSEGDVEWGKSYGGSAGNAEAPASMQQTTDGGYAVAGNTDSFSIISTQLLFFRLDSSGNIEWQKVYSFGGASDIQQTSDGGYIVAGVAIFPLVDNAEFWLFKLDPDGNIKWQKVYDAGFAESVQQTADGGYVLAGSTREFGLGSSDFWVMKVDSEGNIDNCARDFIHDTDAAVDDINLVVDEAVPAVEQSSADVKDTEAIVENTSAATSDQCGSIAYSFELFDTDVSLGQQVRGVAETTDPSVESVTFRWINPIGDIVRQVSLPVSTPAEDNFTPDEPGEWLVEADFGNGQVISKTISIGFFVLPESPIGAIAIVVSGLAALGLFTKFRRRSYP